MRLMKYCPYHSGQARSCQSFYHNLNHLLAKTDHFIVNNRSLDLQVRPTILK